MGDIALTGVLNLKDWFLRNDIRIQVDIHRTPHKTMYWEMLVPQENGWKRTYHTSSPFPYCFITGEFRKCEGCDAYTGQECGREDGTVTDSHVDALLAQYPVSIKSRMQGNAFVPVMVIDMRPPEERQPSVPVSCVRLPVV